MDIQKLLDSLVDSMEKERAEQRQRKLVREMIQAKRDYRDYQTKTALTMIKALYEVLVEPDEIIDLENFNILED